MWEAGGDELVMCMKCVYSDLISIVNLLYTYLYRLAGTFHTVALTFMRGCLKVRIQLMRKLLVLSAIVARVAEVEREPHHLQVQHRAI